ncbi:MAG: Spy/CpxP family protein refolding chaperone [Desulfuromonadales bacterium]|nr:Spy/CpxP family protein refolding chaperone [Desulfuromonadales bacterium]
MNILRTVIVTGIVIMFAASPLLAKGYGCGKSCNKGHGDGEPQSKIERIKEAVELTQQQEAELSEILDQQREETSLIKEKLRAAKAEMRELFQSDSLNEAQLRQLAQDTANLKVDLMIKKHAKRSAINDILTAEQQHELQEVREKRQERREHRKENRRQGMKN